MLRRALVLSAAAALAASFLMGVSSAAPPDTTPGEKRVCAQAPQGFAACFAHVRTKGATPDATTSYSSGYQPSDLITAYGLTGLTGSTPIAIVDAYANPNVVTDLAAYRNQFGLGTANLTEYGQTGGARSAVGNVGWGQEQMLDLDMASAICPTCPLIYVGANSTSFADLGQAVNTAVAKGAKVVSNSYGGNESSGAQTLQGQYYTHPGVAITVSSGDNGYGPQVPAAFSTVTAVGGTRLVLNGDKTRSSETAWSGAGSGCSAYIAKPIWQSDTAGCSRRTIADVSAVADPATGVAIYDSYGSTGGASWYVFGGTSVAAPIIAGIYGLSGSTAGNPAQLTYTNRSSLFDVTSGANGRCTTGKKTATGYLCTAGAGYDGPTGNGAPKGSLTPF